MSIECKNNFIGCEIMRVCMKQIVTEHYHLFTNDMHQREYWCFVRQEFMGSLWHTKEEFSSKNMDCVSHKQLLHCTSLLPSSTQITCTEFDMKYTSKF